MTAVACPEPQPPADTLTTQAADGSRKYRLVLEGRRRAEAAAFRVPGRARPYIACISSQAGCPLACAFCATRDEAFARNLTSGEMLTQVRLALEPWLTAGVPESACEVSFMGMGEPLLNVAAVVETITTLFTRYPGMTRVSLSSAAPPRGVARLLAALPAELPVHLQLSLHATSDTLRRQLVPRGSVAIDQLLQAGRRFHLERGDVVCLNYLLLPGLNDRDEDIAWLGARIHPDVFYLKISQLNPVRGLEPALRQATTTQLHRFADRLTEVGLRSKVFVGDGIDIDASCGQMASVPRLA